ncbi:MAG: hypothetical protein K1X74_05355 [Pirellulales bacterium]|nr:hypothetical protein [Pirellulales bacterium]
MQVAQQIPSSSRIYEFEQADLLLSAPKTLGGARCRVKLRDRESSLPLGSRLASLRNQRSSLLLQMTALYAANSLALDTMLVQPVISGRRNIVLASVPTVDAKKSVASWQHRGEGGKQPLPDCGVPA